VQFAEGDHDKINAGLDRGGPALQVKAVEDLTGIPIDHYMELDFAGFVDIVDAFNGVDLCLPEGIPVRDTYVGLDAPSGGCQHYNGIAALNFVRSRHTEFFINGEWQEDPEGDLGRIKRQHHFLDELLKRALTNNAVTRLPEYASIVGKALTFDSTFSSGDLTKLAQGFSRPSLDAIEFLQLPGIADTYDGVSYVFPKEPEADQMLARLGGGRIPDSSLPFGREPN
jgi:LCP family protein required for cell wall assembly